MGGGLMQLVAYGAQDVYLTGHPEITFFKVVYRRHTNFSMECSEVTMNGNADFGRKVNATITRSGDLLMQLYLRVVLKEISDENFTGRFAWVRRLGHALIDSVEISIGGAQIDKHYGTWMDIWYELSHDKNHERGYEKMIGDVPELTSLSTKNSNGLIKPEATLFIPLQFWFCRNPGLALPIIALQYHEIRIEMAFQRKSELGVYTADFPNSDAYATMGMADANLLVNYVYLDAEERRKFSQVGHEYLIEQLQFTGAMNIPNSAGSAINHGIDLKYNHPTKELIWALKNGNYTTGKSFLAYTHKSDWTEALDDAAANLANGMFYIGAVAPVNAPHVIAIDAEDGSVNTSTINTLAHKLNYITEVINNCTDPAPAPVIADAELHMIQDVFYINQYNLADTIDDVSITVTATGPNATPTFTITKVQVLTHTMSVRDISIPVDAWTDIRVSAVDDLIVRQHCNYGTLIDGTINPVTRGSILLNGHERFDAREGDYFNYVQPYEHHTRTPADGINVYSFAITPENHQPSGSANLSRIDSVQLKLTYADKTLATAPKYAPSLNAFNSETQLFVYDRNNNVLRIMSGMGGVAYSN